MYPLKPEWSWGCALEFSWISVEGEENGRKSCQDLSPLLVRWSHSGHSVLPILKGWLHLEGLASWRCASSVTSSCQFRAPFHPVGGGACCHGCRAGQRLGGAFAGPALPVLIIGLFSTRLVWGISCEQRLREYSGAWSLYCLQVEFLVTRKEVCGFLPWDITSWPVWSSCVPGTREMFHKGQPPPRYFPLSHPEHTLFWAAFS